MLKGEIHPDIKVAMREIQLADSKPMFVDGEIEVIQNQPLPVYDTSGPYTDPEIEIDVKKGLPKLRQQWILDRGDVEELDEISSEYGREQLYNSDLDYLRFEYLKKTFKS